MSDHAGKLIHKAWGFEFEAFDNGAAAIWVLHIAKKRKTSLHCHPNKKTTLILLSGSVRFSMGAAPHDLELMTLEPLESITIPKGIYHQTEAISALPGYPSAENGAWLLEIEEPSNKEDLARAQDDYGRVDKPYETDVVPYTGPLLRISETPQSFMGYIFRLWKSEPVGDICIPIGPQSGALFLTITKDFTVKLSDYVADFVADLGVKHVFSVVGGGSMHLCDSFGNHERIKYVPCHHEQAAAMAADAYARFAGIGCALVTTGPGGTNSITGVACAWIDSIPVLFISGQVTRDTLLEGTGVRQFGVQESDIVTLVKSITKYAVTIKDEKDIRYELEKAVYIARSERPGPVWLDIPLDLQSKQINPKELRGYPTVFSTGTVLPPWQHEIPICLSLLRASKRPVLIVGNGVRLAGAQNEIRLLVDALGVPVITSWAAADMIADSQYHIGHMGIFGDRASNFTVQNADLLLVIGCRLSVPMIGYRFELFAPNAKIIMVDVDENEIKKPSMRVDLAIVADAKAFISEMLRSSITDQPPMTSSPWTAIQWSQPQSEWLSLCNKWKDKYPVVSTEYATQTGGINSYYFVDLLSQKLPDDAIVVLDQGAAFTCTYQAAKMKPGQRWIAASGCAPMGFGLPGAIGAHYASGKKVICIVGDGALQFNLQELATIAHNKLPIIIFVLNNGGYLTIKHMQSNHFNRFVGSEEGSGVSFPSLTALAGAYVIPHIPFQTQRILNLDLLNMLNHDWKGPLLCEIMMPPDQPLIPRVSSKKMPDGSIRSSPIHDMFPFLDRDEFNANMVDAK